jgi:type I restriction enzyme S subunit
MGLTKYPIGQLVEPLNIKCGIPKCDWVSGVNIYKRFMPSRNIGTDTSNYLIVPSGAFAFNLMHVGRDGKIPVAINDTDSDIVVSSAYFVFRVIDESVLLKEYLYIQMTSPEFDRYVAYCTDASVRDGLDWIRFCEIEINLPPLPIQQKYVAVYNAMIANQRTYESGLKDLNVVIAASIEKFKHTAPRVPVGTLLEEIDIRNSSGAITDVKGINIKKEFMPSVANLVKTDLKKYKVIRKDQFAANFMHVMRDERIPMGLYSDEEPCIISPAYPVFELKSEEALAEYIMLWFTRSETDRYAAFISDSSVRGGLELNRFYELEIPLPSKEKQQAIVNFYKVQNLIQQNITAVGTQLKDLCPILIKGALQEGLSS